MEARRSEVWVTYNGTVITPNWRDYKMAGISEEITDFSYTEAAEGASDAVRVSVGDPTGRWIGPWLPHIGDKLEAKIILRNWYTDGDEHSLDCGTFTLDAPSGSFYPSAVALSGVSKPANEAFDATERDQIWQNTTIQKVAAAAAARSGLALEYNAGAYPIRALEQKGSTDSATIKSLCDKYGLAMKIFRDKLVIYDPEILKRRPATVTLYRGDMPRGEHVDVTSFKMAEVYDGAKISYTEPIGETEIKAELMQGGGTRILQISEKADDADDARRILAGRLAKANHKAVTVQFSGMADVKMVAASVFALVGYGAFDGPYFIDQVTFSKDGGGTRISGSASKIYSSE